MDDVMLENEVIDLLGRERFKRLRAGNWLAPFFEVPGHEGRPVYIRHLVDFRHEEDLRLHPEGRPVVTKAYAPARGGGVPEVVTDRDGIHRVVVKVVPPAAAGCLTPRVRAALEEFLEKAERMLAGWR
jgi:hypothetical protein